jgi:hypothetical protein
MVLVVAGAVVPSTSTRGSHRREWTRIDATYMRGGEVGGGDAYDRRGGGEGARKGLENAERDITTRVNR